jgi:hypothetical protein
VLQSIGVDMGASAARIGAHIPASIRGASARAVRTSISGLRAASRSTAGSQTLSGAPFHPCTASRQNHAAGVLPEASARSNSIQASALE